MHTIFDSTTDSFQEFHDRFVADVDLYKSTGQLFPNSPIPEHVVNISMIPWTSFTGFNLNVNTDFMLDNLQLSLSFFNRTKGFLF
ncbi:hypothetical protein JCM10914A_47790 [Paenibacillus sp. JCM 10914]|nr:hydrolase [Paenibacillus sp. JCM 10914]